ncbi:MAG: DUF3987 domain-containing protein [Xanthobacteraceae bacterium]
MSNNNLKTAFDAKVKFKTVSRRPKASERTNVDPVAEQMHDGSAQWREAQVVSIADRIDRRLVAHLHKVAGLSWSNVVEAPTLSDLTNPPGLVGEIMDWIVDSSSYPSRELALGPALCAVATIAGRAFETPSYARTNLYVVGLAESGFGKDHARTCIKNLMSAAGLSRFIGPSRFASAAGVRQSIVAFPSYLSLQDEFGGFLTKLQDPRSGSDFATIRHYLMEFFSSASSTYEGDAYAKEISEKIHNPNLSIYGTSTPDDFWPSLTSSRMSDGFLPRFLLINVSGEKPEFVEEPPRRRDEPPAHLIDGVRKIAEATMAICGNLGTHGHGRPAAKRVELDDDAKAFDRALRRQIDGAALIADSKPQPFLNRTREHALKIALTVAVGVDPDAPVITGEILRWAAGVAAYSTQAFVAEADKRLADSDRERNFNRVMEIIREAGTAGITEGKVADKIRSLKGHDLKDILGAAEAAGHIVSPARLSGGKGRPSKRLFAAEYAPPDGTS